MVDLDYAKVTGRLAITVGDTSVDVDDNPDVQWCDEGVVRFTPLVTEMHVIGDPSVGPFTAGNASIVTEVGTDGRLYYPDAATGDPFVMLLDLGSDKVNPKIERDAAAYRVTFEGVRSQGVPVEFTAFNFHPVPDDLLEPPDTANDITKLAPVPAVGGSPIVQGPRGISIEAMAVEAGELVVTLDDGSEVNAGALPIGPGGSDAGVAGYFEDDDSDTNTAARAKLLPRPTADLGDWALLRRDTSDVSKGVKWATASEAVAKGLGSVIANNYPGIVADGTDISDALSAMADDLGATTGVKGARVWFAPGEYVVSSRTDWLKFSGIIDGAGLGNSPAASDPGRATVFRWTGPSSESMWRFRDYRHVKIQNIRFEGNDTTPPLACIESYNVSGDSAGTGSALVLDNVMMGKWNWSSQGSGKGAVKAGVLFSGDNTNNDQFAFRDLTVVGPEVGVDVNNSQSIWGTIENLYVNGATVAGVRTSATIHGTNWTFNGCAKDVQVNSTAKVHVHGWFSETSSRPLDIPSAAGGAAAHVTGGLWRLQAPMTGSGDLFINAPNLTANGGVFLDGVDIITSLGTHPKAYIRSAGGGSPSRAKFVMVNCATTMTISDFDVAAAVSNNLDVEIRSGTLFLRRALTSGQALTEEAFQFNGWLGVTELAAEPAAPPADGVRVYALDNGAGKTQLRARFNSGNPVILATEGLGLSPAQAEALLEPSTLVAWDAFTRANAASLGTSDSGHTWTAPNWTISSNRAKGSASVATGLHYLDAGVGNVEVMATIRRSAVSAGLAFRVTDIDNGLFVIPNSGGTAVNVYKRVAGVNTSLGTAAYTWPDVLPQRMRVVARNDVIKVYLDGERVLTTTLSSGDYTAFPTTLTKAGFYIGAADTTSSFDNFAVRSLA